MIIQDLYSFKQKALHWAASFEICCCLDSNDYTDLYGNFDFIIAAGSAAQLDARTNNKFDELKNFYELHRNWIFGLMTYDLKNEIEDLNSSNPDHIPFPELFFFVPEYLIAFKGSRAEILIGHEDILDVIHATTISVDIEKQPVVVKNRISRDLYLKTVEALQLHIARGDIYEINFCQEFFAEHASINPIAIYHKLTKVSPTPFSGFFRINNQYILSASPERFLCKKGDRLVSQPIKGTAKRSLDLAEDERIKSQLRDDIKEQAENVMIVDLVRNDLTKSAVKGSVKVDELFGIYAFPQVYQMISTISCQLNPEVHFIDAVKNAFPMGSMTGAPKLKAMKLIEEYEFVKRGAYSGAFGYITPDADFDFNVIIRSILYDATKQYLSFQVGGAITYAADASEEYEECMLKASAIIQTLTT